VKVEKPPRGTSVVYSGRELGRARVAGIEPSIGQIFIGTRDDVYFPTTDATKANGYLNRVFVAPTGR
jgi:hypothetical protein